LKDSSGSYVYRDDMKAELLNDYFTSVFPSDNNNVPYINRRCSTEIGDIVFTPCAVERQLRKLKAVYRSRRSEIKYFNVFMCLVLQHYEVDSDP